MSTYRIYFETGASASVKVEADSLDEAIDKAYEHVPYEVCAQCSGWGQDYESLDLGEWEPSSDYEVDGNYVDGTK